MSVYLKSFCLFVMFTIVGFGLSAPGALSTWSFMEAGTLAFLSLLALGYSTDRYGVLMKFFILQAFSGMVILVLILWAESLGVGLYKGAMSLVLLLKMGAVPLHTWLLNLGASMSWESLYLFLTVQKFIPLLLLSALASEILLSLALLSWGVASAGSFTTKSLKKLFIYSSLFFMGLPLVALGQGSTLWATYLFLYATFSLPLFISATLGSSGEASEIGPSVCSDLHKIILWVVLLNLAGLPPFPGFFLKLNFIVSQGLQFTLAATLLLSSLGLLYMYMMMCMAWLPLNSANKLLSGGAGGAAVSSVIVSLLAAPFLI